MQVLVLEQEGKTGFDKLILLNQKHKLNLELMHQPITKPRDKILQTIVKEHLDMPILLLEKGMPHLVHHNEKTITKTALNWQSLTQRIVRAGRKSELILQACKVDKDSIVIDGTAGFGYDGLILASACGSITLIEKNPIIALLLFFEKYTMSQNTNWQKLLDKINIIFDDINQFSLMQKQQEIADVVYLDPMFPKGSYQAKVSKTMQSLHLLADAPNEKEAQMLFYQAKTCLHFQGKLVVKRPIYAKPLANMLPNHQVGNDVIRFDIYQNN